MRSARGMHAEHSARGREWLSRFTGTDPDPRARPRPDLSQQLLVVIAKRSLAQQLTITHAIVILPLDAVHRT